jgi:hypothetical protein
VLSSSHKNTQYVNKSQFESRIPGGFCQPMCSRVCRPAFLWFVFNHVNLSLYMSLFCDIVFDVLHILDSHLCVGVCWFEASKYCNLILSVCVCQLNSVCGIVEYYWNREWTRSTQHKFFVDTTIISIIISRSFSLCSENCSRSLPSLNWTCLCCAMCLQISFSLKCVLSCFDYCSDLHNTKKISF